MAKRRSEYRALDIPIERIRQWLVHDDWFGLDFRAFRDLIGLGYSQRFVLGSWANNQQARLSAIGRLEATAYDQLAQLASAEGTAISLARVIAVLHPAQQTRILSGQRVIIRSVSEEVNQALLEASLYLPTDALAGEEVWLQAQRTVRHHWACVDTGTNPHSVSDLLFSKPGESLRAFRQQVKDAHKKKFVPAEVEVITLHLGARGRTIASPTIELVRLGIGKKGYP